MNTLPRILVTCLLLAPITAAADDVFLRTYCVACHGPKEQESDLRLDTTNRLKGDALAARWHKIRRMIEEREMPPQDAPQPDEVARSRFLKWIQETYGEATFKRGDHWAFQPIVRHEIPSDVGQHSNPIDAFVRSKLKQSKLQTSPPAERRTLIRRVTLDLTGLPPTLKQVQEFVKDPSDVDVAFARVVDRLLRSPQYGERWAQHWLDVIRWAETVGFETNLERTNAWHYRDWVIDSLNEDKPYDRFIFEQLAGDTVAEDAALGFAVAGPANLPGQIGRDTEAMRQARQDELDEVIRTVSQSLFGLTIGCARCHDHKFDPIRQRDYYAMQATFAGLSYGYRRLRGEQNDQWAAQVPKLLEELERLRQELYKVQNQFQLHTALRSIETETFAPLQADAVRMEIAATCSRAASLYEFQLWSNTTSINVALASEGAKPSASSFALANQTRHFDNLIDGSVDKRQAFPWAAAQPGPAWIQIDLSSPARVDRVVWYSGSSTPASYEIKVHDVLSGKWKTVADTHGRVPRVDDLRAAKDVKIKNLSAEQVDSLMKLLAKIRATQAELTRLSNGPQVYAARFEEGPALTYLLKRGDPMQRAGVVAPGVPSFLNDRVAQGVSERELERRLALVRHLTRPDHPLTSRVMVNRVWQHHFGVGLVETPSDFGRMGARPSHPKLLDWLATEFVANGWSLKKLHRLIVMSQAYRQSSRPRDDAMAIDAESRLLWRFRPRRLNAEAIRDSILAVSGKLNTEMHGRGFDFFDRRGGLSDYTPKETFDKSGWRRMIYAHKIRMESVDIFGAFDCPDAGQMTPRRPQSITPIQSLGLFNSPFANRQAAFLAERVRGETSNDLGQCVDRAFELALARRPDETERARMIELAKAHGLDQVCRVIFNSSEFVFLH